MGDKSFLGARAALSAVPLVESFFFSGLSQELD